MGIIQISEYNAEFILKALLIAQKHNLDEFNGLYSKGEQPKTYAHVRLRQDAKMFGRAYDTIWQQCNGLGTPDV